MRYRGPQNQQIDLNSPVSSRKKRVWIFVLIALVVLSVVIWMFFIRPKPKQGIGDIQKAKAQEQSVRLIAVGDNIPHDTVNQQAIKNGNGTYNYLPIYDQIQPFFAQSDLRFCNQEAAVGGVELGISGYPTFNAPVEFAKDLHKLGCNIINTANNHVADKGLPGIINTRDIWDTLTPSAVSGANRSVDEQNKVNYFEKKGIKFAFVAFNEYSNNKSIPTYALNGFDEELVSRLLKEARNSADFVIVSAHWGTEDSPEINSAQEMWAKSFADNGADLVIGTGPHVLQPVKEIPNSRGSKTLVWFSIGNFMSSQLKINELVGGIASMEIAKTNGKASIKSIGFLPTYMHYDWSAADATNQNLLARKNLKLYPLDKADNVLNSSTLNTTVQAQQDYVKGILNKFTPVTIYSSDKF